MHHLLLLVQRVVCNFVRGPDLYASCTFILGYVVCICWLSLVCAPTWCWRRVAGAVFVSQSQADRAMCQGPRPVLSCPHDCRWLALVRVCRIVSGFYCEYYTLSVGATHSVRSLRFLRPIYACYFACARLPSVRATACCCFVVGLVSGGFCGSQQAPALHCFCDK